MVIWPDRLAATKNNQLKGRRHDTPDFPVGGFFVCPRENGEMDGHTREEAGWRPQTRLVRGGLQRSAFCETSEAIYATSGFVYDAAEDAEDAFANRVDRYIYSRYDNPTVGMFRGAAAPDRGRGGVPRDGVGHGGGFRLASPAWWKAGDRVVGARALFGSCLYCSDRHPAAAGGRDDHRRKPRSGGMAGRARPADQGGVPGNRPPTRASTSSTYGRYPRWRRMWAR